jgi:hypothetical protein
MKWALIYLFSSYSGGGVAIWDTGFRTTSYDVCTRQAISIRETLKTKPNLTRYGGQRVDDWSCVPIGG